MNDKDYLDARYSFMQAWLGNRQTAGGPEDPLFAFANVEKLAKINSDNIGYVKLKPKPNAHGYRIPAEREYRTWHGDAFEIVGYEKV